MQTPLATTDYDHVVVIDSQIVLEAKPLGQFPWGDLFPGSVLLVVVRQVQTEIDRKKSDGRLGKRARAFNALLDDFIEKRVPSTVSTTPKIDVATVANRAIDWNALDDLDRDDGDDRIVAQALNAKIDDLTKLVLLSHDMRPRDAAATHGLKAVKLPEAWLKDPEPSPNQKRIIELESKIKLLSADQPEIKILVEALTPEPWIYRIVASATAEQMRAILECQLSKAPRQSPRGQFEIGLAKYDHSHGKRLEVWEAIIHEDTPLIHHGLTKLHAQHRIRVTVENVGAISAEGLSLEIRSGNVILYSKPYWVLVNGPCVPRPRNPYNHFPTFNPNNLSPLHREPFRFYWDAYDPSDFLRLSCASFRQSKKHSVEISVELSSRTLPKAQIEALVTASNMKGVVQKQLLVHVESTTLSFDDAYNTDEGSLNMRPLVDLRTENFEVHDYVWLRNGGKEFEPD